MHSRAIVLVLKPALPEESVRLDHSSPSRSAALIDVRRQLAAWSATVRSLPAPRMPPSLYSRRADNWRPLLAVAELAGGDWPKRALAAIEEVRRMKPRPDLRERLLVAIRDAFDDKARKDAEDESLSTGKVLGDDERAAITARPSTELVTKDLLGALNADEESGIGEAYRGGPITAYWLRDHLHGLLDPPGSQMWRDGTKVVRGYRWYQFADAYRRHLPSAKGSSSSATSATSDTTLSKPADLADVSVADVTSATGSSATPSATEKSRDSTALEGGVADVADVADTGTPSRGDTFEGVDGPTAETPSPPESTKPQANDSDREDRPSSPAGDPLLVNSILRYVELHPDASVKKISAALGIKTSTVERVLAEWRPSP
jgi:hypothetical protein